MRKQAPQQPTTLDRADVIPTSTQNVTKSVSETPKTLRTCFRLGRVQSLARQQNAERRAETHTGALSGSTTKSERLAKTHTGALFGSTTKSERVAETHTEHSLARQRNRSVLRRRTQECSLVTASEAKRVAH